MTRIGVIKPGSTYPGMIERFGDYDAWFARVLGPLGADCVTRDLESGPPPDPESADGWIVTGARGSVHEESPVVARLLEWVRAVARAEVPLLGVCYGHQAICAALGGKVERHPGGWELGSAEVELTEAGERDPLFEGFPHRFLVQTTHEDRVALPPPDATLLATNPHTEIQAIGVGARLRGVQFHPEVTVEIAGDFAERRRHLLARPARIEEAPWGTRVLTNFVERFVRSSASTAS
ncbi:MAG: gamma-glutamyl-gamma-aminobutyrate hydrolase family protein [Gemmatimonadetes bacterium]|nr:gamma-glutamyl-gamma-aminobutyrate hydrolase family protein [Gemmatimonadota bacterium]